MSALKNSLSGIRVLDFTQQFPGPYATLLLSDFGAEVWKIEPPGGDPIRSRFGGVADTVNRGKRSVEINLKDTQQRDAVVEAAGSFDVVAEGFRPGVMARLGVGFDELKARNDRLVYCSLTGYRSSSHKRDWVGHDVNYVADAGAAWYSGPIDEPPSWTAGIPVADVLAGSFAALAIVAAVRGRKAADGPVHVEIPLRDTILVAGGIRHTEYFAEGYPSREDMMARGSYGIFECSDSEQLAIGAVETAFWQRLCKVLELEDLANDESLEPFSSRNRRWREVQSAIAERIATKPSDYWLEVFDPREIPVSKLQSPKELEREFRRDSDSPVRITQENVVALMPPLRTGDDWLEGRRTSPRLNEDSEEFWSLIRSNVVSKDD